MTVTIHLGELALYLLGIYLLVWAIMFISIQISIWRKGGKDEFTTAQHARLCLMWPLLVLLLPFTR